MKKLIFIFLFFICFSNLRAEVYDLYKCFRSDDMVDFKGKDVDLQNVKWTDNNFNRFNKIIVIDVDKYINILKNLPEGFNYGNYYGYDNQNIWDYWVKVSEINKKRKYDNEIYIDNLHELSNDEIKLLIKNGGKEFSRYNKWAWTINTDTNELSNIIILSEKYLWMRKIETFRDNIINEDLYKKRGIKPSIHPEQMKVTKYTITDYVGGVILANNSNTVTKNLVSIVKIDLNTLKVSRGLKSLGVFSSNFQCSSEYSVAQGGKTGGSSGTAFFVTNKGHLLTNNHVVEGCAISKIIYDNKELNTDLISVDKTLDLALLKANIKPKSYIKFMRGEPKKRQKIIIAGYPLGQGLSDDLKINDGRISSLKGFENNTNEITVDIAINPGNSGGPIVNENGELVAVAVAGLSKEVTEGINFGIKSAAADSFLKSNKVSSSKSGLGFSLNDDKIVDLLEKSTVYTYCN